MVAPHGGIACFGPFRLSPAKREIERNGVPLALGDRALDILIALVEHRWAIGTRDAIRAAGGTAVADAWVHPADLAAAGLVDPA